MAFSDDFLKAFGRITVNFQALEMYIASLTWIMISPDTNVGQIVTSQVSFNRLCDLLASLFRYRVNDPALVERLEDFLRRASDVEHQRNTVFHSVWLTDDAGAPSRLKITSKRKQGLNIHTQDMEAQELNAIADSIRDVAEEFMKFIVELFEANIISSKPTS